VLRYSLLLAVPALCAGQSRVIESVLPGLEYSAACTSSIELSNLSARTVRVAVEGHHATGGLASFIGHEGMQVEVTALEHVSLRLENASGAAWAKVRETVPAGESAAVAVRGSTECVAGKQLRAIPREAAFPTASPWFSGNVAALAGSEIALINTSDAAVTAIGCYSSGTLVAQGGGELAPVCSESFRVQVPPFGTRQFPVRVGESTHFSIRTQGRGIVLQMMRPVDAAVRLFRVDSSIQFGSEVPGPAGKE
jgi:hypothetical protein